MRMPAIQTHRDLFWDGLPINALRREASAVVLLDPRMLADLVAL
jgi:hypothetical protein